MPLSNWIQKHALPTTAAGFDAILAELPQVELLALGEALHGAEAILILRNRLFQHLVEQHQFRALALECSFPQARCVNDYIVGRGDRAQFEDWLGHGMGILEANRELIEWMRAYNETHPDALHFYGFDMPLGKASFASPRFVLDVVENPARKQRIADLIGPDGDWENMAVIQDPSKGVGTTPRANELRVEIENLIAELRNAQPGRTAAQHDAALCRQLLAAHAMMASGASYSQTLGIRDAMMADNLEFILNRERSRGRVFAFAHNSHLKRSQAQWSMGAITHSWWPAGARLSATLGPRYAIIGTGIGESAENGIAPPAPGSLESLFTGDALLSLSAAPKAEFDALPTRSGSALNPTYFPWSRDTARDFDHLAFVATSPYHRGGLPLQAWDGAQS
ncbi:MAG: erythromycin esterase family protein [Kiritimatiellae bacterium]|nr:erythromycin esterase family protein [Kiritimatiellia bacterium]MCO5068126.1 erythromycin esterase family protein [Kiritimatiellia bacterium]